MEADFSSSLIVSVQLEKVLLNGDAASTVTSVLGLGADTIGIVVDIDPYNDETIWLLQIEGTNNAVIFHSRHEHGLNDSVELRKDFFTGRINYLESLGSHTVHLFSGNSVTYDYFQKGKYMYQIARVDDAIILSK